MTSLQACNFYMNDLMSAYDITGFLRTAYRLYVFCLPSKPPEHCVPNSGVTLIDCMHLYYKVQLTTKWGLFIHY